MIQPEWCPAGSFENLKLSRGEFTKRAWARALCER
jgi:hypothetical protein